MSALLSALEPHLSGGSKEAAAKALVAVVGNPKVAVALRRAVIARLPSLFPAAGKESDGLADAVVGVITKIASVGAGWTPKEGKDGYFSEVAYGAAWLASTGRSSKIPESVKGFLRNEKLSSRLAATEAEKSALLDALLSFGPNAEGIGALLAGAGAAGWKARKAGLEKIAGEPGWSGASVEAAAGIAFAEDADKSAGAAAATAGEDDEARWPGAWPAVHSRSSGDAGTKAWELAVAGLQKDQGKLMDALVLSRAPRVIATQGDGCWSQLVHQRTGEAPGALVVKEGKAWVDRVLATEGLDQPPAQPWLGTLHPGSSEAYRTATLDALSLLVKLDNGSVTSGLVSWALARIADNDLDTFNSEDYKIWKTPASELAFDPVAAKRAKQAEKAAQSVARTKDEKFDAQLRKELAAKGKAAAPGAAAGAASGSANLSKEEKELQDAQFKKEAEVRARAEASVLQVRNAFGVLRSVVDASTEADVAGDEDDEEIEVETEDRLAPYIAEAVDVILKGFIVGNLTKAGASDTLAGSLADEAIELYTALGECAGWRLGAVVHPPRLQVAILRAYGVKAGNLGWKGSSIQGGFRRWRFEFNCNLILSAFALQTSSVLRSNDSSLLCLRQCHQRRLSTPCRCWIWYSRTAARLPRSPLK